VEVWVDGVRAGRVEIWQPTLLELVELVAVELAATARETGPQPGAAALRRLAEAGEPAAQLRLGLHLLTPPVGSPDVPAAVGWLEQAAGAGSADAATELARLYQAGEHLEADPARAEAWLARAFALGSPTAAHMRYEQALHAGAEPPLELLERAAAGGHRQAQYELGRHYLAGDDLPQAVRWLTAAAHNPRLSHWLETVSHHACDLAHDELGLLCLAGRGVTWDLVAARAHFEAARRTEVQRAIAVLGLLDSDPRLTQMPLGDWLARVEAQAAADEPGALAALTEVYTHGIGVAPDRGRAIATWRTAAAMGVGEAAYRLWMCSVAPEQVPGQPTPEEGRAFLARAAALGHPTSMLQLAHECLWPRDGQPADPAAAIRWYEAAGPANPRAYVALGEALAAGRVLPCDPARAFACFQRAAEAGDPYGLVLAAELAFKGQGEPARAWSWLERAEHLPLAEFERRHLAPRIAIARGGAYERGLGVAPDPAWARTCYEQGEGWPEAMVGLGRLAERDGDHATAAGCYLRAAEELIQFGLASEAASEALRRLASLQAAGVALPPMPDELARRLAAGFAEQG